MTDLNNDNFENDLDDQRVMAAAIVRKGFNDHNNNITTGLSNYTPTLDKFALKVFN